MVAVAAVGGVAEAVGVTVSVDDDTRNGQVERLPRDNTVVLALVEGLVLAEEADPRCCFASWAPKRRSGDLRSDVDE